MEEGADTVLLDQVDAKNPILPPEQGNPIEQVIEKLNQLGDLAGLSLDKVAHDTGRVGKEEIQKTASHPVPALWIIKEEEKELLIVHLGLEHARECSCALVQDWAGSVVASYKVCKPYYELDRQVEESDASTAGADLEDPGQNETEEEKKE
ncbi:hypothetical protein AAES_123385 [Amazona aestiva]|uniref:Uncharacterized protein n=1 Tax=Amazona aestiva TaxID=12930 RepID=A0A0Q3M5G7_AMAAE|nr:hypothetical protein AAES_123385 [Amazona aestiva]